MAKEMKIARIYATDDKFAGFMDAIDAVIAKYDEIEDNGDLDVDAMSIGEIFLMIFQEVFEGMGMPKGLVNKPIGALTLDELKSLMSWAEETFTEDSIQEFAPVNTNDEE